MTGIVWAGPVFDPAGYGSVSRNFLRGLAELGVPLKAVNLGEDHSDLLPEAVNAQLRGLLDGNAGKHPLEIVHYEPGSFARIRNIEFPAARIGCTIFETDRIPHHWVKACNEMDEIWVPSRFNRETFANSGVARRKIRVIPYSVDTDFYRPISERFEIRDRKSFAFLYVSFWDWRKGFDLLLSAFIGEFTKRDDVTLIIRTNDPEPRSPKSADELRQLLLASAGIRSASIEDLPHIALITEPLTQQELRKLYNSCDLYISSDRANGWGMPCMEAMAMGKPAATIDWSGSTEFMNAANSLLIRPTGRLIPVDRRLVEHRPIYSGHLWAEVTVEEVRRVMRHAFNSRDELQAIAKRGFTDIRENYSLLAGATRVHRAAKRSAGYVNSFSRLRRVIKAVKQSLFLSLVSWGRSRKL